MQACFVVTITDGERRRSTFQEQQKLRQHGITCSADEQDGCKERADTCGFDVGETGLIVGTVCLAALASAG